MKIEVVFLLVLGLSFSICNGQNIDKIINAAKVHEIVKKLSNDDMQGRKCFTTGIDKAANYIASEFKTSNLKFFSKANNYFQEFKMTKNVTLSIQGMIDNVPLTLDNVAVNTTSADIIINSLKDYELVELKATDSFEKIVFPLLKADRNILILADTAHTSNFKNMQRFSGIAKFPSKVSLVMVLTSNLIPSTFYLQVKHKQTFQILKNVIGIIPGKSKKNEYVIFGGHYDHLGVGKPDKNQDSIFNGANDNASGVTAVIMLSRYFSRFRNNERTLIFIAFSAEEMGGLGSRYFSQRINSDQVIAMFNIEMIGTLSKWGANSAYITGYEKSDFGKILQANLTGSEFYLESDPYPKQNLFYRSDNTPFASLGVPAHTISTAKMEEAPNNEPNYHKQSDEVGTLEISNMVKIIKAIAISSKTIVSGKEKPMRVDK